MKCFLTIMDVRESDCDDHKQNRDGGFDRQTTFMKVDALVEPRSIFLVSVKREIDALV